MTVCRQQIRDEVVHPLLGCRWEMLGDVQLANRLTHGRLDEGDTTLPPRFERRGAVEDTTVKIEVLVNEGRGEERGQRRNGMPTSPRLPLVKALIGQHWFDLVEERGLVVDDGSQHGLWDARALSPQVQVETWMSLRQLIKRLRIKGRRYISAADLIPVVRCDLGLEIQDDPRLVVGVIQPGQGEHLGNVALIGLANLGLVVVTIVGLVGQAKPSLAHPRYVMRGVGRARLVGEVEQGTQGLAVMLAQQCHELGRRRHAVDACQDRGQGAGAGILDRIGVHEAAVQFGQELDLVVG